ncbi:uncharacterized protein LOC108675699 [Hyalella azteca]|uniref:Uncharacterized protein LOC108675699 n=1 Tax=Hyalella azteca TaxID=294128 RepID=A0A8B7NZN8_HYAAZ|nr:uncharacterized protein LOC108675699 [Hyalella azteca]
MASSARVFSCLSILLLLASSTSQQYSIDAADRIYKFYDDSSIKMNSDRNLISMGRSYGSTLGEFQKVSRRNVREKDIAAIFRGVAYGITESSVISKLPETTTATTTTTSTTTSTVVPVYKTSTRLQMIEKLHENENSVEAFESSLPLPEEVDGTYGDPARNGILNYFMETDRRNEHEAHNGRREYYPSVISSISPISQNAPTKPDSYILSKTNIGQTMHVHIYMTGILMGLIVLISLVSLCRIHTCTHLIPRGHYVTLQLLILLAGSLRCIILLHDPYGLEGKLPRALISLLMNSVSPILSTAFALMLLILLRASRFSLLPAKFQSPLVLAVVTGIHIGTSVLIDISNGVLHYPDSARKLVTGIQCFTIGWNMVLIVGYVCLLYQSFIRVSKRRVVLPQYTCAVMCLAVLLQAILIVFSFHHIFSREFQMNQQGGLKTWSWWVLVSFERLIEIFLCASLLAAAATLTIKQSNSHTNEQKIFSVGTSYEPSSKCNKLNGESPTRGKKFIASNYALASTMQKKANTMNGNFVHNFKATNENTYESTGDFTIRWNLPKPDVCSRDQEGPVDGYSPNLAEQERRLPDHSSAHQAMQVNSSSLNSRTLPRPRYYCAPVPIIETDIPVVSRVATYTLRPQKTHNIYCEIEDPSYDVTPYYTKSIPSTSSEIYSSPHILASNYMQDQIPDPLYELPQVHNSAGINQNSATFKDFDSRQAHGGHASNSNASHHLINKISGNLMLPLHNSHSRVSNCNHSQRNSALDTSPDSAIVLDYSSHSELEEQNGCMSRHYVQKQPAEHQANLNNRIDYMKMSTHSLNDVFKHNSGLLSKLVGSSNANTGYQPLNVDDSQLSSTDILDDLYEPDDGESPLSAAVESHKSAETEVTSPRKAAQKSSKETAKALKVSGDPSSSCDAVAISCSSPVTSL